MNKQIVYIPTKEDFGYSLAYFDKRDRSYQPETNSENSQILLKPTEAYVFTEQELKQLLEDYTNRIAENVTTKEIYAPACDDHTPYWDACVSCGRYDNPDVLIGEEVDKESIISQLPSYLKEIRI